MWFECLKCYIHVHVYQFAATGTVLLCIMLNLFNRNTKLRLSAHTMQHIQHTHTRIHSPPWQQHQTLLPMVQPYHSADHTWGNQRGLWYRYLVVIINSLYKYQKLVQVPVPAALSGRLTAKPSGKFWIPIPSAKLLLVYIISVKEKRTLTHDTHHALSNVAEGVLPMAPNPTPTARPSVDVESRRRRRRRRRQEIKGNMNVRKYSYNSSVFFSCFHYIPATVVVLYIFVFYSKSSMSRQSVYQLNSPSIKESGWGKA